MHSDRASSVLGSVADSQIVANCLALRKPIPPEVACRVRQEADLARKELLAVHGVQNVGVQIIREIRGELPAT
jgi:hypothetical protein